MSAQLKAKLTKLDDLTNASLQRLDTFENRLSQLKNQMQYVHEGTLTMTIRRSNIQSVLDGMEGIMKQFQVAMNEQTVIAKGIDDHSDLVRYINSVKKITQATTFFRTHKSKSAGRMVEHLSGLEETAANELSSAFQALSSRHLVPFDLHSSPPEDKSLGDVARMGELASGLMFLRRRSFLDTYVQQREGCVTASVDSLSPLTLIGEKTMSKEQRSAQNPLVPRREQPLFTFVQNMGNVVALFKMESQLCHSMLSDPVLAMHTFLRITESSLDLSLQALQSILQTSVGADKTQVCFQLLESDWWQAEELTDMFRFTQGESSRDYAKRRDTVVPEALDYSIKKSSEIISWMERLQDLASQMMIASIREVEQHIESHTQKTPPATTTVHQLTTNVLQYIKILGAHRATLSRTIEGSGKFPERRICVRLLQGVVRNLGLKGSMFKAPRDTTLFVVNNLHRIVTWLRLTFIDADAMATVVGEEVMAELTSKFETSIDTYLQAVFAKCLDHLLDRNAVVVTERALNKSERHKIKDRFSGFNLSFDETYATQRAASVPDPQLRDLLRTRCRAFLVPLYQDFLKRYGNVGFTKNLNKYLKYPVETVESMIASYYDDSDLEQ